MVEAFNVWNVTMGAFIAVGFLAKVIDNGSRAVLYRFDNPRIIRTGSIASLELTPPALSMPEIITKRVFDFTGALLLLILLLPLFAVEAMLIKRDSKGPVFFL